MVDDPRPTPDSATHVPVLLGRVLALLAPALDGEQAVAVDATLGLGGHAEALLAAHPRLTLVGLDRDPDALGRSERRLARFAGRVHLVHAVYDRMPEVLDSLGLPGVDGVLFDLGVSSLQLDVPERGFAYAQDAPLDMRMDASSGRTAADVVNGYSVTDLARVLREFGEERFALRIAQAIARARPVRSTAELAELVRQCDPGGHPPSRRPPGQAHLPGAAHRGQRRARCTALRRPVGFGRAARRRPDRHARLPLPGGPHRQAEPGRARHGPDAGRICRCTLADRGPQLRLLTRGSESATAEEIAANPRAASVRLRAAERIRQAS